jgi:hypothetical protein
MSNDWFPTREQDVVALAEVWDKLLADAAKRAAFGWDAAECAALRLKIGGFTQKRRDYKADDSSGKLLLKDEAKGVLKPAMRVFARGSIRFNDKMSPEDKLVMGIRPRDPNNTPKGEPRDLVDLMLSTIPTDHRVIAGFRVEGSKRRGKGPYHAVEVCFCVRGLGEPAPLGPDVDAEAWHSVAVTASPWEKSFLPSDAGKRLYITMRWENLSTGRSGEAGKGPWCGIVSIIIP